MKKIILIILVLTVGAFACKKEKETTKTINDAITSVSDTIGTGTFVGQQHSLSGNVILYKDNSSNHILRLQNFNMTGAPDADVFLSTTSNYVAGNIIKISDLTSNANYTNSAINIDVAENIDFAQYKYVIVWCTQYSAYFGYAPLQ